MNGEIINSYIDRIAACNGSAKEELKRLVETNKITKEEAAVIWIRASLKKVNTSLDSAIKTAS
jgi:hypothetical protein